MPVSLARMDSDNGRIKSYQIYVKIGCSLDNSACEGFFGHLKTEMSCGRNWDEYSINDFIQEVDTYIRWYRSDRIKSTLGGLSPLDYRRSIGIAV